MKINERELSNSKETKTTELQSNRLFFVDKMHTEWRRDLRDFRLRTPLEATK